MSKTHVISRAALGASSGGGPTSPETVVGTGRRRNRPQQECHRIAASRVFTWLSGRQALVAFAAGLSAGLVVLGIGGRLAMSLIALALGLKLHWSWGGSAQVILLGAALGPAGGLLLAAVRDRLPGPTLIQGLIFGGVFGGIWTAVYFLRPAGPFELSVAPVLGSVSFGGLMLLFGVVLSATLSRLDSYPSDSRTWPRAVGVVVALVTLFGIGLGLYALMSR